MLSGCFRRPDKLRIVWLRNYRKVKSNDVSSVCDRGGELKFPQRTPLDMIYACAQLHAHAACMLHACTCCMHIMCMLLVCRCEVFVCRCMCAQEWEYAQIYHS